MSTVYSSPKRTRPYIPNGSLEATSSLPVSASLHAEAQESSTIERGISPALDFINTASDKQKPTATAIIYCEGNFGKIDGKTANGLIRHSEMYRILSVIDSEQAGFDTGTLLDNRQNGIPVYRDMAESLKHADGVPDYFIFGMAPASGMLSTHERGIVLSAIGLGMNIVNGLHEFLNDDPEFSAACFASNVSILDIRKPRRGSRQG